MAMVEKLSLLSLPSSSLLPFLGIDEKDLPYQRKPKINAASSKTALFTPNGHDEDEGSQLLSRLTGIAFAGDYVANVPVRKFVRTNPYFKDPIDIGLPEQEIDISRCCSSFDLNGHYKEDPIGANSTCKMSAGKFEKAIDTTDLRFWMYMVKPDGKSDQEEESCTDADSEEMEQRAANKDRTERVVTIPSDDQGQVNDHTKREEYRARVKESLGFVRMRIEMLQELSVRDSLKDESSGVTGGGDPSSMSSSSVLLKHSRKMAGLLHTEEQSLSLQDLYQWFQNIGKTLGEDALGASPKSILHNQLEKLRSVHVAKDLFKYTKEAKPSSLPSSSEVLKQVEHDVRDRLANLYQGKNYIMSHQAENRGSLDFISDKEAAYEVLGTAILQSLKEMETMEEDFHVLQSELVSSGCPVMTISHKRSKKSSHKGKKKGASTDSDGMNSGSSRSESSSAPSSSRPANMQAEERKIGPEQPSGSKISHGKMPASDDKNDSKDTLKTKKKKSSQRSEKRNGEKAGDKNDAVTEENKESNPTSEDASSSLQSSSPILLSSASKAIVEKGKGCFLDAAEGMNSSQNEPNGFGISAAVVGLQAPERSKADSFNIQGQSFDGSVSEPLRSSRGEGDFVGIEKKVTLPKVSMNIPGVNPSDSASPQILPKLKRKSRRSSMSVTKDEMVQTDDVAILSLEDCNVDALQIYDYQTVDIKDLLEKMKKLQKQLQFWRTKNWAEKHTGQGHMMPPPTYNQFIKVDASPDMGMLCYYNSRTGAHVMKSVAELDSSMQSFIMNLVDKPRESPKNF